MLNRIIEVKELGSGIVQVRMQDRVNKNSFTRDLTRALTAAFEDIASRPDYKAVVLTGYDSHFSSGGTQDDPRDLLEVDGRFTGKGIHRLVLDCPIPVIAAMQGHGIGGGLVLGMSADLVVLAQESFYAANFLKEGVTPGMGSTLILPMKLGMSLAEEMMLTANPYRGQELEERGVPFRVVPRDCVIQHAIQLARGLAEKPRSSLVALKEHLVAPIREQLPRFVERELAMHEFTYHRPEARTASRAYPVPRRSAIAKVVEACGAGTD